MEILLIDDHSLFREGLILLLEDLNFDIEAFEADSYESATAIIEAHPDIGMVLLDLALPGVSHIEAVEAIQEKAPDIKIVVLSGSDDRKIVETVLKLGVNGYIPKSSPSKIMLSALQLVISGGIYIPPEILQGRANIAATTQTKKLNINHVLTPRQCDVLTELSKGKSNKEIGRYLDLTESTVRVHVAAILKAFNVKNRTHAVQYALQNSWL